ncbi:trans-aconitate 2-methyltransferase [Erwinia endophytica]|uniref:trans-aconitate 2-methyltransferase n=1 Tax=Erwinia endophytica TaxID=1563158 RepID=UPI001265E72E|nr:trans-aconitate 2-methyltransferase [Erwinia endophytica]KAB8308263.1 trans-aconitate 2-methyltransferase [Erwinia endophytica]
MKDWDPDLYRQFEAERTRPAKELLSRIPLREVDSATDLGCGPGNSTELLRAAWPSARITGVDSSKAMLEQAFKRLPDCRFVQADIRHWVAETPQQVIFANASLQWLTDHQQWLPHLVAQLSRCGVLAVQMPDNLDQPTHSLMRKTGELPRWKEKISSAASNRARPLSTEAYYDVLCSVGCSVDIWRTTYYHVMPSPQAIVDWLRATGLRPFLAPLEESEQETFLARYLQELQEIYRIREDGCVLLPFPRLFMVAQKR